MTAPALTGALVACPGLGCAACGAGLAAEQAAPGLWAWVHAGVRPPGCPSVVVPAVRVVYLCHLDPPYRHARHYLGSADDLPRRLHRHAMGRGARLLAVAVAAGSRLVLVRLWVGDRDDEQRRKRAHNAPRACPLCTSGPARPQRPATVQGVLALAGGRQ
jgi:hypothetical protein